MKTNLNCITEGEAFILYGPRGSKTLTRQETTDLLTQILTAGELYEGNTVESALAEIFTALEESYLNLTPQVTLKRVTDTSSLLFYSIGHPQLGVY